MVIPWCIINTNWHILKVVWDTVLLLMQTASRIHLRHIHSVRVHRYAVNRHRAVTLHSYTHTTWVRFWGSGSLVESIWYIWCHCYVMVEGDSHLKLLASRIHIRHIQSVWAHWYAVHRHMLWVLHSYTHTTWLNCCKQGYLPYSSSVQKNK